jgi:hypothetical protein
VPRRSSLRQSAFISLPLRRNILMFRSGDLRLDSLLPVDKRSLLLHHGGAVSGIASILEAGELHEKIHRESVAGRHAGCSVCCVPQKLPDADFVDINEQRIVGIQSKSTLRDLPPCSCPRLASLELQIAPCGNIPDSALN